MSNVTLGSSAVAVPVMRHRSTNATSLIIIVSSFVRRLDPLVPAGEIPGRTSDAGSGRCLRAAEPFVETNAPEARLAQRHERALLDPAAVISGFGIAHDHTRIANGLQIAGDNFVERCSFRASDLDDAVPRRRDHHFGNSGGNVLCRDWPGNIRCRFGRFRRSIARHGGGRPLRPHAAKRLRPEVSKNSSTALSSNEGELARSTTT